jgi:nitrite reductase/ring-hydroxylating ferredoxin subunit
MENSWFVIERSVAVQSKPVASHLLDRPIVLVRTSAGSVIALEDRCPHQGVPLSHGRLGPKGLMCRYHGWSFDGQGRCTAMPGMESDCIEEIRVKSYLTQELHGLIWGSRGTSAVMPTCLGTMRGRRSPYFLWEQKRRESAADLQDRLSDRWFSEGSVVQMERHAGLGCAILVSLCITPETLASCRVFAVAQIATRWLPEWLAEIVAMPVLKELDNPQALLGSDLPSGGDAG